MWMLLNCLGSIFRLTSAIPSFAMFCPIWSGWADRLRYSTACNDRMTRFSVFFFSTRTVGAGYPPDFLRFTVSAASDDDSPERTTVFVFSVVVFSLHSEDGQLTLRELQELKAGHKNVRNEVGNSGCTA